MPVDLFSEQGAKCIADGIHSALHTDGPGGGDAAPLRAAFRRVRSARRTHLVEDTQDFPDDFNTIAPMTLEMFVQGDCDHGLPPDLKTELWEDALETAALYWQDNHLPMPFPKDKFAEPEMPGLRWPGASAGEDVLCDHLVGLPQH